MRKFLFAASVLAFASSPAFAQAGPTASDTAQAKATVIKAISINCGLMDFGILAPLHSGLAIVVMPANGQPLVDSSNVVVPGSRDFSTPAPCIVSGETDYVYNVTLPAAPINLMNGAAAMELGAFTVSTQLDGLPLNRQLNEVGQDSFGIGATLKVPAQSPAGVYTGQFLVSVQYQ